MQELISHKICDFTKFFTIFLTFFSGQNKTRPICAGHKRKIHNLLQRFLRCFVPVTQIRLYRHCRFSKWRNGKLGFGDFQRNCRFGRSDQYISENQTVGCYWYVSCLFINFLKCQKLKILGVRFYVKSISGILEVQNVPF